MWAPNQPTQEAASDEGESTPGLSVCIQPAADLKLRAVVGKVHVAQHGGPARLDGIAAGWELAGNQGRLKAARSAV